MAPEGGPSDIFIQSRSDNGPSGETLVEIFRKLEGLGNKELTKLVGKFVRLTQNGHEPSYL